MAVDEEIFTWFKLLDQGQTVAIEEENFNPFIPMDQKKSPSLYLYGLHGFTEIGDNGDDAEEAPYIGASNGEIQWFGRSEALFSSFKKVKEARLRTRSWPSMAEQQFKLEEE